MAILRGPSNDGLPHRVAGKGQRCIEAKKNARNSSKEHATVAISGPTTDHHEIRRWAEARGAVPVEVLPLIVDSVPALLRLMLKEQAGDVANVMVIAWEDFFCKFDALGLTFVYDNDATGYNELLQLEDKSPYRRPADRPACLEN